MDHKKQQESFSIKLKMDSSPKWIWRFDFMGNCFLQYLKTHRRLGPLSWARELADRARRRRRHSWRLRWRPPWSGRSIDSRRTCDSPQSSRCWAWAVVGMCWRRYGRLGNSRETSPGDRKCPPKLDGISLDSEKKKHDKTRYMNFIKKYHGKVWFIEETRTHHMQQRTARCVRLPQQLCGSLAEIAYLILNGVFHDGIFDIFQFDAAFVGEVVENVGRSDGFRTALLVAEYQVDLWINQSINLSIEQLISQSINWSINESTSQSINQSIDRSINQSINRSNRMLINQSW